MKTFGIKLMHRDEEIKTLKELYFEIQKLNKPLSSKNNMLDNLIENILELDPHYTELTLKVIEGGKVSARDLYDIEKLKNIANSITFCNKEDAAILEECKAYLNIIYKIDQILDKLS